MRRLKGWIFPAALIVLALAYTALAWSGSHFALVLLAVTSVIGAVLYGMYQNLFWDITELNEDMRRAYAKAFAKSQSGNL